MPILLPGLAFLLSTGAPASAAEEGLAAARTVAGEQGQEGPRIGLALSAGAARGLAHIGVLKALEENAIRVDCIAGTSMGAIIGALYASGHSAAEIEALVRSIDWQLIFSAKPERPLVPLSQRVDMIPPVVRVGFDFWEIRLPQAIDSDYRINRLLTKLLAAPGIAAHGDFDQLPIRYRAVAADLETGDRVVLSAGSLPRAARASMSTPVTLPPIRYGDRLLVDGGIADRLPVGVVRDMGAEVVIAVEVGQPPLPPEMYRDALGVAIKVVEVQSRARTRSFAQPADVLIVPALEGIATGDYDEFERIIAAGHDAAMKMIGRIRERSPGDSAAVRRALPSGPAMGGGAPPGAAARLGGAALARTIQRVRVGGNECVRPEFILDVFAERPGADFDLERGLHGMDALHATRLFESVWLDFEANGPARLTVDVQVKEAPRQIAELGAAYNEGDNASLLLRMRNRNLLGSGENLDLTFRGSDSELAVRGQLAGDRLLGLPLGYYVRASASEEKPRFFLDHELLGRAEFERESFGAGVQRQIGTAVLLRAGASAGRVKTRFHPGVGLPAASDRVTALDGLLVWDDLDDRSFPTRGRAFTLLVKQSLKDLNAALDYRVMAARGRLAMSAGKRTIFDVQLFAGGSAGEAPIYDVPRLGGPVLVPGLERDELWGRQALAAGTGASFILWRGLRFTARVGAGNVWEERDEVSLRSMLGGFGVAVEHPTRFGPLSVGWGRRGREQSRFYLSAGYD